MSTTGSRRRGPRKLAIPAGVTVVGRREPRHRDLAGSRIEDRYVAAPQEIKDQQHYHGDALRMQAHFGLLNDHPIDRERGTLARVGYLTNQPRY